MIYEILARRLSYPPYSPHPLHCKWCRASTISAWLGLSARAACFGLTLASCFSAAAGRSHRHTAPTAEGGYQGSRKLVFHLTKNVHTELLKLLPLECLIVDRLDAVGRAGCEFDGRSNLPSNFMVFRLLHLIRVHLVRLFPAQAQLCILAGWINDVKLVNPDTFFPVL